MGSVDEAAGESRRRRGRSCVKVGDTGVGEPEETDRRARCGNGAARGVWAWDDSGVVKLPKLAVLAAPPEVCGE